MSEVTINEVMAAYAGDAQQDASRRGVTLDYSEESLSLVDQVLGDLTKGGLIAPAGQEDEELLWTLSKAYGGYVGEVVVKTMGGSWEMKDNDDGSAQVVLRFEGIACFPLEKIYKRLTEDEYSGVGGYCRALRAIVARRQEGH